MLLSVRISFTCLLSLCLQSTLYGWSGGSRMIPGIRDTVPALMDTANVPTLSGLRAIKTSSSIVIRLDSNGSRLNYLPFPAIQQLLKGNVAGLYVRESSGEPGTAIDMLIRGSAVPFTNPKDVYESQPLVVLDGIPLVSPHPFVYDIQKYSYVRLGTATDMLNRIDVNDIASVRVIKDAADAAVYGPRAVNGVIEINTRQASLQRSSISINSWFGVAQKPHTNTMNAATENSFRGMFYDKYGSAADLKKYPSYLRDSTNPAYYGPADWTDLYYHNAAVRGINANISGGYPRANFRFSIGNVRNANPADNTRMDRYTANFSINMKPLKWLTMSTMLNGAMLERKRNTYLRDRFAEMRYLPDLTNPLSPNKENYGTYLTAVNKSYDNNKANAFAGFFRLKADVTQTFNFTSQLSFDYNEDMRDVFYPGTLLETNNFVSNFAGYGQRVIFDNAIHFAAPWGKQHSLKFDAGYSLQFDQNKYDYIYAYKGPNDLIRINQLDQKDDGSLEPKAFLYQLVYKYLDKERQRLASLYGRLSYSFMQQVEVSLMLRSDASSNMQEASRWFVSPTASVKWEMKPALLGNCPLIDHAALSAGWGRIGRLLTYDRFAQGPQYTVDMGWTKEPVISSYGGISALMRPYTYGYIGNGVSWPYSDQLNAGLDVTLAGGKISFNIGAYSRTDKNMLIGVPAFSDYGYTGEFRNGMVVRNAGVDLTVAYRPLKPGSRLQWNTSFTAGVNRNKLLALPGELQQITIGDRHLEVGKAIDQFWVLKNEGIYNDRNEVPVDPKTNQPLNYQGIPLTKGDPKWKDQNGDFTIDDKDKTLTGHYLPVFTGGWSNDFTYGNFSFGFSLYAVLGRTILNKNMSDKFDFINRESTLDMNAVKEITSWSKTGDYSKYPVYNPWSSVVPYRTDQDLFLENGSFVKLRSVMLGYDLTGTGWWKRRKRLAGVRKLYVYGNAVNLLTLTRYSGRDPELINFNGYDTGYGLPIPRTYTLGLKVEL